MTCEILTGEMHGCAAVDSFVSTTWLKESYLVLKAHKWYLLLIIKESSSFPLERKMLLVLLILRYCTASSQNSAFPLKIGCLCAKTDLASPQNCITALTINATPTNVVFSGLNYPCALLSLSMSGKKICLDLLKYNFFFKKHPLYF